MAKAAQRATSAKKKTATKGQAANKYPAVGQAAPAFSLPSSDGHTVKLSDFKGKSAVVLFFYPKDLTSGCTVEACSFRDSYTALKRAGAAVFGVSGDPLKSHDKFIDKHGLNYPLLSDESHKMMDKYGVWQQKSMYGRKYMGVARTTVIIDKTGKVAKVFEKVKPAGHADEILNWIKENH